MLDDDLLAEDHEYQIETSDSPVSVDGYALGEPKKLRCWFCDAEVYLTEQKTPGVWELTHAPWCPNADN